MNDLQNPPILPLGVQLRAGKFHPHMTLPSEVMAKRIHKTVPTHPKTNMIGHNGHNHTYSSTDRPVLQSGGPQRKQS